MLPTPESRKHGPKNSAAGKESTFWKPASPATTMKTPTRVSKQHYLAYLKARAKDSRGSCHLVSKITSTDTNLVRLLTDPQQLPGYGLAVNVNGPGSKLLLDTGASGILLSHSLADKAGLPLLSDYEIHGIGDKGGKDGYTAIA